MPLDIAGIQSALAEDGLDGWLLFDFKGSNPIARKLTGLDAPGRMTTRRWFYLIPRTGAPRGLVHAIERHNLGHLAGDVATYSGRESLERSLDALVDGLTRVAMEYSPLCAIPYLSRLDAGTLEMLRARGLTVVGSGDLVQRFEARWDAAAIATHRAASASLYRVKDRAFAEVTRRLRAHVPTTEYDIQTLMLEWFAEEGITAADEPNVSAQENAGNPHYQPTRDVHRSIGPNELLLLDLWGKQTTPGAVYADITWVAFTGTTVPTEMAQAFAAVAHARDAAIQTVERAVRAGDDLRGWQVDRAARGVLDAAGYGPQIWHRTGHSLGEEVHGNGVNMDDYETHDDRRLLPGTGFTIEPGVYFPDFGVRTEINMVVHSNDALVTGPVQDAIIPLFA